MKTLQAFWHWVDNEKPAELSAGSFMHLSDLADQALDSASDAVAERIGSPYRGVASMRDQWPAIRDLSLAICEALERMHAAVPEGEREPDLAPHIPSIADATTTFRGRLKQTYSSETRELNVYTGIDREGVDGLRGLTPKSIIVNGAADMFAPGVLDYLNEVIQPMLVDGARLRRWPL